MKRKPKELIVKGNFAGMPCGKGGVRLVWLLPEKRDRADRQNQD